MSSNTYRVWEHARHAECKDEESGPLGTSRSEAEQSDAPTLCCPGQGASSFRHQLPGSYVTLKTEILLRLKLRETEHFILPTPPSRSLDSKQSPADVLRFAYLVLCLGGHSSIWGHRQTLKTFWLVESNPEAESEGGVGQPHQLWARPSPPWGRGHSPGPEPTRGPWGLLLSPRSP